MFSIYSWPNVILHLDADAFFASVVQATKASLKGKPIVVGKERGIATAFSYEAKRLGVTRGMMIGEIRRRFPECIITSSDYKLYELFSARMFNIIRSFSPTVEKYSIDEGFVDIKGLRRPLNATYSQIGERLQRTIRDRLGISVSIGISTTKSLAKLASSYSKPYGLTIVPGKDIEEFLKNIPIRSVWGIGEATSAYLEKLYIHTAFDLASKNESFVRSYLSRPFYEIWRELRGQQVYTITTTTKHVYKSITKSQTVTPPTNNKQVLWARLNKHIESAFIKTRRLRCHAKKMVLFLKTQKFKYHTSEIKLLEPTIYPLLIRDQIRASFQKIYQSNTLYRATGCTLSELEDAHEKQYSLFSNMIEKEPTIKKLYDIYEAKKVDFGLMLYDQRAVQKKGSREKNGLFSSSSIELDKLNLIEV